MITLFAETLQKRLLDGHVTPYRFYRWDDGDAFTEVVAGDSPHCVCGSLIVGTAAETQDVSELGEADDPIRILALPEHVAQADEASVQAGGRQWQITGYVRNSDRWEQRPIQVIPLKEDLFSRTRGLIETDVLADMHVLTGGLGSGGAPICLEFAKLGGLKAVSNQGAISAQVGAAGETQSSVSHRTKCPACRLGHVDRM